ncbi:hypothetical protein HQ489_05565 [Candidatus Woesearchaeota archaeon]|nr:hypothetical protein [Candidatus Woesearchaeota archaeon]
MKPINTGNLYELRLRTAYNNLNQKSTQEIKEVISRHKQFDEGLSIMPAYKRIPIIVLYTLVDGIEMPGKRSPEYDAASKILEERVAYFF